MYRRFLNDGDYEGVLSIEHFNQLSDGRKEKIIEAESNAEMSIIEYLSESYEIEAELIKGKFIAEYDRKITFPVGAYIYVNGKTRKVIRSISGYKAPASKEYWEEVFYDVNTPVTSYSQFNTYKKGDVCAYNSQNYVCVEENGFEFNDIRIPGLNGWEEVDGGDWMPISYELWSVVKYNDRYYTLVTLDGFDNMIDPFTSDCWGAIADYDPNYNEYDLSGHDYVVFDGKVFRPVIDVNSDTPEMSVNIAVGDPRNLNVKKHMVRLAAYELAKSISPNNVSAVRLRDYEDSMMWLKDASRMKLNPMIPRKVGRDNQEVLGWQFATFQTEMDPNKNPWQI